MDTPIVLSFYLKPSSNSSIIRSIVLKDYFSQLTSNVEVLYPTQILNGLLLCKSKRTEEKILNMRHVLPNGSTIILFPLSRSLFQQVKCSIDTQMMQMPEVNPALQQSLPFLHASGGRIQINPDGSAILEGHIFILNSIHLFLLNKTSKPPQSDHIVENNSSEILELRSRQVSVKVMTGKLIEQNVEGLIIPMNDKYKIHKAFDRQIQSSGGISFSNYFKDLSSKGTRVHEGEVLFYPNHELKIPAKIFIIFTVPRLTTNEKSTINSYQPTYEQMIYRALQTIDQYGITSVAMPVLEPNNKSTKDRRSANEMAVRAMVTSLRQFSYLPSIKLKRFIIVDHPVQINRMSKRVKQYQHQTQPKTSNNIDLDTDECGSFTNIFGVPKIPDASSNSSESDENNEPEEYILPYVDHAKS